MFGTNRNNSVRKTNYCPMTCSQQSNTAHCGGRSEEAERHRALRGQVRRGGATPHTAGAGPKKQSDTAHCGGRSEEAERHRTLRGGGLKKQSDTAHCGGRSEEAERHRTLRGGGLKKLLGSIQQSSCSQFIHLMSRTLFESSTPPNVIHVFPGLPRAFFFSSSSASVYYTEHKPKNKK